MKAESGCNKVKARREGAQVLAGEESAGGEGMFGEVVFDAEPVVEALQGEVEILGGLEFDDGEAAMAIGGEEVDEIAILGGEGGNLSVDGFEEGGIDFGEVAADLEFEAGFRGCGRGWEGRAGVPGTFEGADPVAGVGEFDGMLKPFGVVGEEGGFQQIGVQMFQTKGGGNVLIEGEENGEAFDRFGFAVTAAQIVVPNEGEGEGGIDGGDGRGEEGAPAAGAAFDDRAGVRGGE